MYRLRPRFITDDVSAIVHVVEIPKVKIPVVSLQRSVRVAVLADASHFRFHFRYYKL